MSWLTDLQNAYGKGAYKKAKKSKKPISKQALLLLEQLEKRELPSLNVWLPQRIEPLGGANNNNLSQRLFRPVTTEIFPWMDLQTSNLSQTGTFSFTNDGQYDIDLHQSGTNGTNLFEFNQDGSITFSLSQSGNFLL